MLQPASNDPKAKNEDWLHLIVNVDVTLGFFPTAIKFCNQILSGRGRFAPLPINSKILDVPPFYSTLKHARRSYPIAHRTHQRKRRSSAAVRLLLTLPVRFGRVRSGRLILNRIFSLGSFKIIRPPQTQTNSFRRRVALRESWIMNHESNWCNTPKSNQKHNGPNV